MRDLAQDILCLNNGLSDMRTIMEQTQAFENRMLERLNVGKTVHNFLITTVELLIEAMSIFVLQVFHKDDYAVKYAVEPPLDGGGPPDDLSVRLKLIYDLSILNRPKYEGTKLLMALREGLSYDGNEYVFADDEILGSFGRLHCVTVLSLPPQFGTSNSGLHVMRIQRYRQVA